MTWGQFLFKIGLLILFLSRMHEQALAFLPGCLSFLPSLLSLMGARAWAHDPFLFLTFVCSPLPQHTRAVLSTAQPVCDGKRRQLPTRRAAVNSRAQRRCNSPPLCQVTPPLRSMTSLAALNSFKQTAQSCADTISPPQSWKRRTHEKPHWILPLPNAHSCFIFLPPSFLFL